MSIAATHSQARYALPTAVRDFRATHTEVLAEGIGPMPGNVPNDPAGKEKSTGVSSCAAVMFNLNEGIRRVYGTDVDLAGNNQVRQCRADVLSKARADAEQVASGETRGTILVAASR